MGFRFCTQLPNSYTEARSAASLYVGLFFECRCCCNSATTLLRTAWGSALGTNAPEPHGSTGRPHHPGIGHARPFDWGIVLCPIHEHRNLTASAGVYWLVAGGSKKEEAK